MARRTLLTDAQLSAALGELPEWSGDTTGIERTIRRIDLTSAAGAVADLAAFAEDLDHHPDLDIRWQTLRVFLTTHSAGGVTDLDLEFARRVDEYFDRAAPDDRSPALQSAFDAVDRAFANARARRAGPADSGA